MAKHRAKNRDLVQYIPPLPVCLYNSLFAIMLSDLAINHAHSCNSVGTTCTGILVGLASASHFDHPFRSEFVYKTVWRSANSNPVYYLPLELSMEHSVIKNSINSFLISSPRTVTDKSMPTKRTLQRDQVRHLVETDCSPLRTMS